MPKLKERQEELQAKREHLAAVLAEAKNDDGDYDHASVKAESFESGSHMVEWISGQETELAKLNDEVSGLQKMSAIDERNRTALDAGIKTPMFPGDDGNGGQGEEAPKSLGDLFVEKFYDEKTGVMKDNIVQERDYHIPTNHKGGSIDQVLKTDMTTAAGWAPENLRIGRTQLSAQRPIAVADLFPVIPTSQAAVVYMLETTFTNNAAETAENAAIPENALALTETTVNIRKIAASLPVTSEQLADVEQVRAYIDQRLRYALMARIDLQLITGAGTGVLWEGLKNVTGIQSVALSNEIPETVHQGITDIRVNGFDEPDEVILHPTDWDQVATLKDSTGGYVYAHPASPAEPRLWGKRVTLTTVDSAGTGYVGAFAAQSALYMRQGIDVAITDSHASEFLDDVLRLKFTVRGAPVFFRPASFGELTGI